MSFLPLEVPTPGLEPGHIGLQPIALPIELCQDMVLPNLVSVILELNLTNRESLSFLRLCQTVDLGTLFLKLKLDANCVVFNFV